jgi:hypothetical protein
MYAPFYLNSHADGSSLRIGVILGSRFVPACFVESLKHINCSNFAKLELAVFCPDAQSSDNSPRASQSLGETRETADKEKQRQHLLFTLYQKWDSKRISESEDPLRPVDCSPYIDAVETISIPHLNGEPLKYIPEEVIGKIQAKNLDVLIHLGFEALCGDVQKAARYGIWSWQNGDCNQGDPPYFWEVYDDNPISSSALVSRGADKKILCEGCFATRLGSSWSRNKPQPYWGSSTFLIQKLHQLHQHGWEQIERAAQTAVTSHAKPNLRSTPTNKEMAKWLSRLAIRTAARRVRRFVRGSQIAHWMLAVNPGSRSRIDSGGSRDLSGFRWIQSPPGHFYADPFLIDHCQSSWVFFEDLDYSTQKGVIACAEVKRDGSLSETKPVLEKPYHLSYPCVFHDGGEMYMIPESLANEAVELYRCAHFPDRWDMVQVLLKAPAVDSTICVEAGLYWLFVTLIDPRGAGLQLWLFHSRTLAGEWTPHRQNPISTDARTSRGGGAIYHQSGRFIRPSQDCTVNYGRRITLNEILVLNEIEYLERPTTTVEPEGVRHMIGTHTYAQLNKIEVIDGCFLLPSQQVLAGR